MQSSDVKRTSPTSDDDWTLLTTFLSDISPSRRWSEARHVVGTYVQYMATASSCVVRMYPYVLTYIRTNQVGYGRSTVAGRPGGSPHDLWSPFWSLTGGMIQISKDLNKNVSCFIRPSRTDKRPSSGRTSRPYACTAPSDHERQSSAVQDVKGSSALLRITCFRTTWHATPGDIRHSSICWLLTRRLGHPPSHLDCESLGPASQTTQA